MIQSPGRLLIHTPHPPPPHIYDITHVTVLYSSFLADEVSERGVSRHHAYLQHREEPHGSEAVRDGDL